MRTRLLSLLLAAVLVGCGDASDPAADNYGYGWHYDAIGESGLRVRWESAPNEVRLGLDVYERLYVETEACAGISAPGPLVIVVPDGTLAPRVGYTHFDTGTVLIETSALYMTRHEYVHYLLAESGYPAGRNAAHDSLLFESCG